MKLKKTNLFLMVGTFLLAAVVAGALLAAGGRQAAVEVAASTDMTVYMTPTCGCCTAWVEHMEANGFAVTTKKQNDLTEVKLGSGITRETASCHTAFIDGYVVEGHVPAAEVKRLLAERPDVTGLTVPGMPMGSPGMEGAYDDVYDVLTFDRSGNTAVFARYDGHTLLSAGR